MADQNYISLQEATEYCNYSQEYLSLRARQGKLKSVKFGRNWVTKKEWLDEYLQKVEEYNDFKIKEVSPPKNLPVEPSQSNKFLQPQFAVAIVLTIVFLFGGLFLLKENSEVATDRVYSSSQLAEIEKGGGNLLADYFAWLGKQFVGVGEKIAKGYTNANDFLEKKIGQSFVFLQREEKPEVTQEPETTPEIIPETIEESAPRPTEEGLVVVPSTEKDEAVVKKIKDSFSDEVKVEIKDESSGIITPVFREGDGENYLYILVPIDNENN